MDELTSDYVLSDKKRYNFRYKRAAVHLRGLRSGCEVSGREREHRDVCFVIEGAVFDVGHESEGAEQLVLDKTLLTTGNTDSWFGLRLSDRGCYRGALGSRPTHTHIFSIVAPRTDLEETLLRVRVQRNRAAERDRDRVEECRKTNEC